MTFSKVFPSLIVFFYVLHAGWIFGVNAQSVSRLGHLNVNKDFVSVSGYSSGGTFAQQMFVSHSSQFSGVAVFSHTFYRCGYGNGVLNDYDTVCTRTGNLSDYELYSPNNAIGDIHSYSQSGLIDDPGHMGNKPLYVFAGTNNYLFTPEMSLRIVHVFKEFIKNPIAIKTHVSDANLTLPSYRSDLPPCGGPTNSIQVSNCGYYGALEALQHLLGTKAVSPPHGEVRLQSLLAFDQREFFYGVGRHDMDSVGYIYVPRICQNNAIQCLLHFYFHGCMTGRQFVGADHILNSGYLDVAEANGIIMVFPQAVASMENEIGCWDTFGVTGPLFATQKGAQVTVVKNILDRILRKESHHHAPLSVSKSPTFRPNNPGFYYTKGPGSQFGFLSPMTNNAHFTPSVESPGPNPYVQFSNYEAPRTTSLAFPSSSQRLTPGAHSSNLHPTSYTSFMKSAYHSQPPTVEFQASGSNSKTNCYFARTHPFSAVQKCF